MHLMIITTVIVLLRILFHRFSHLVISRKKKQWWTKDPVIRKARAFDCPYEYILNAYGDHHFEKIIAHLRPNLKFDDPKLYSLVLEVLDAVHFGAILVDDVADNSMLRKGQVAAHRIYGPSETINRAYTVIFNVIMKCHRERPELVPYLLGCITEIHQGQDDSLVWRRDGLKLPICRDSALQSYRQCASLKTGALFRLVGQLLTCSHEQDTLMSDYGWYCQLQNDCKNVFSSDVVVAKGALAEDLTNGEYTYPILVGLYASKHTKSAITEVFNCRREQKDIDPSILHCAIDALQGEEVKRVCLEELGKVRQRNSRFAILWARDEKMSIT